MIKWKYVENIDTWIGEKSLFETVFEHFYFRYEIIPSPEKINSRGNFFIRFSLRISTGGSMASMKINKDSFINSVEEAKEISEKHLISIANSLTMCIGQHGFKKRTI